MPRDGNVGIGVISTQNGQKRTRIGRLAARITAKRPKTARAISTRLATAEAIASWNSVFGRPKYRA